MNFSFPLSGHGEDCGDAGWSLTSADAPNGIRHRAEANDNFGLTESVI